VIVVDTDVISYFWLQMTVDRPAAARATRERDADWAVPYLWRSEFRSVLRGYMTRDLMTLEEAQRFHEQALDDLQGREYEILAAPVLELVDETGHSAYDCEYVVLAQRLGVSLVTGDEQVVDRFPDTAVLLEDFARER
jgi:predicted nucleic acid-binding protein